MMEFNFNTFLGYENEINSLNDTVLIYGFGSIMFGLVTLTFAAFIIRKLGFGAVNSYFTSPLMLSLGLTILVSILPTIVFYVVANDISPVKILYCWITIFIGMFLFVMFNLETIKSFFREFNKVSEQEEFRNRKT